MAVPSGPTASNEEVSKPEHCLVEKLNPLEIEISDNGKHLKKDQEFGVVGETAREGKVLEEKSQKADQEDKNHDIQSNIETSSNVTKTGEPKFEVEGEEIVKSTINLDQNVDVILNQQDSVNEGPQSTEKETKDLEKDGRGKTEDSQTELFSKEVPSIPEATLDHKNEVSVHTHDLTAKEGVESVVEICSKDEKIGTNDEKDQITLDASTIALSQESQNNDSGDSMKEKVEKGSVADEVGVQEAEITKEEKHREAPGISSKEINQDTNELSKQEKDEAPIENETQDKSSSVTLFDAKAEEENSLELDNPDIVKVHHEFRSDYIAKETCIEVTKHTEVLEETDQVSATASGNANTDENSERGEEIAGLDSTKHEERPDHSLLPQNEPEEKKLQTHLNLTSEETRSVEFSGNAARIDFIKEEGENKNHEEMLKKKEKGEEPIAVCDIRGNEIPIEGVTVLHSYAFSFTF